jgi:hypothetical protein
MFTRAVSQLEASMIDMPTMPLWRIDWSMRTLFTCLSFVPGRRFRANLTFRFFQFAEQLSIFVHQAVQKTVRRESGLINQVWSYHAIDEARHLAFDRMMLERNRLPWLLDRMATALTAICCVGLAFIANANEVWSAQRLGVKVRVWHLPALLRTTTAPFKQRIQRYLRTILKGGDVPGANEDRTATEL